MKYNILPHLDNNAVFQRNIDVLEQFVKHQNKTIEEKDKLIIRLQDQIDYLIDVSEAVDLVEEEADESNRN